MFSRFFDHHTLDGIVSIDLFGNQLFDVFLEFDMDVQRSSSLDGLRYLA